MDLVVTVTPNAALDSTLRVDELLLGRRNCVQDTHAQAGGKGVNVARVLAGLGVPVRAVVVVGGDTGLAIRRDLARAQLDAVAVEAPGESRTCVEVVEERVRRTTQIHGPGVSASEETARALVAAVAASLDGARWVALCGSLPPGLPDDIYARIARVARTGGVRVALDASGAALRAGWRAGPDLVRINREEATEVVGSRDPASPNVAPGPTRLAVVSDGDRATVAWDGDRRRWRVTPPRVAARNPIGCGDTMLAGLLAKLERTSIEDALRFATALAATDAESIAAGHADGVRAHALVSDVAIERIDREDAP